MVVPRLVVEQLQAAVLVQLLHLRAPQQHNHRGQQQQAASSGS